MDTVKIGKYISEKRKEKGLTQVELAEILGMSDKSVSKWERGINLPDVSVYMPLCEALGISLNEFFAGEDLPADELVQQSEKNIMDISKDDKIKRGRLKSVIFIVSAALLILAVAFGIFLKNNGYFDRNFIEAYADNSPEMSIATLATDVTGAHLFRYDVDDSFKEISVQIKEYKDGRLVDEGNAVTVPFDDNKDRKGTIAVLSDPKSNKLVTAVASEEFSASSEQETGFETSGDSYMTSSGEDISGRHFIEKDTAKGLCIIAGDKDDEMTVPVIEEIESDPEAVLKGIDYCIYVSVEFR